MLRVIGRSTCLLLPLSMIAFPTEAAERGPASPRVGAVHVRPLSVAPLSSAPLQVRPLRVGPPGVTPPPGTPPGSTPPTNTPPESTPPDDTPAGETPSLQDASRNYSGQLAVFPGAEGFGSRTQAGRGGRLLRVTSLADSGPGTLRAAVNTPGPRTVIFEVGGIIRLKKDIEVFDPYLTIAGQTAPSPGITLVGDSLRFNTHDVLVQHLRIRPGDEKTPTNSDLRYRDGLGARTDPSGSSSTYNIYMDHCSVSWATDENISLWYPNVYDVTISNSIVSEAATDRADPIYSKGILVGNGQRRISIIRNLLAHNGDRNPLFVGDSTGMVVNNVIYNIGNAAVVMGGKEGPPIWLTVVGNVYLPGPDSRPQRRMVTLDNWHQETRLFVSDNIGPYSSGDPWSVVDNRAGEFVRAEQPKVHVTPLTILNSARTLGHVLGSAGSRPGDRDAVDRRIAREVREGTGGLMRKPYDVRLPQTPVARRPLSPPRNPTLDRDGDGYTDVEEWLHCMARKVEGHGVALTDTGNCLGPREGIR